MKHLLRQTITICTPQGTPDSDGKMQWVEERDIQCRYVRKTDFVMKDAQGQEMKISDTFQIADEVLPDGTVFKYEGKYYRTETCQEWRGYDSSVIFGSVIYATNYTYNV